MRTRTFALALAVTAAGCGGGSGTPPSPVPTGVTITGAPSGFAFLGETYVFTMNVAMSNGTVITTGGTWGSDAPAVATVNAVSGSVQIVGLGAATIFVDYQGRRASQLVRATVRYAGRLEGRSRLTRCVDTGDWAAGDACSEFPNGSSGSFAGDFTQADRSVTALMDLGGDDSSSPVTADISDVGELRFQTAHTLEELSGTVRWFLQPAGLTQIRGNHVMRFRFVGLSGYLELTADIVPGSISRAAGEPQAADRWSDQMLRRAVELARR